MGGILSVLFCAEGNGQRPPTLPVESAICADPARDRSAHPQVHCRDCAGGFQIPAYTEICCGRQGTYQPRRNDLWRRGDPHRVSGKRGTKENPALYQRHVGISLFPTAGADTRVLAVQLHHLDWVWSAILSPQRPFVYGGMEVFPPLQ